MRVLSPSTTTPSAGLSLPALSTLLLALPSLTVGVNLDCGDVAASGKHFDFKKLGGTHQVHWLPPPNDFYAVQDNFTFVLDICGPIKGITKLGCNTGGRICAVNNQTNLSTGEHKIEGRDIAGTYTSSSGKQIEPKFTLLRDSKSNADVGREGIRAELHGGRFPFKKDGTEQMAIIEFVCDKGRDGLEGDEKGEDIGDGEKDKDDNKDSKKEGDDKDKKEGKLRKREGSGSTCEDTDRSLRFCGYGVEDQGKGKKADVLRLEWRTKYACENAQDVDGGSHWGFFTWFIIILFLAISAYLIFGSWLNYNRYGARGWDLIPHGDTIRDIPYLVKDFGRRVVGTVQGSGSRGGYSAV